jgi:hypothetical protein
MQIAHYTNYSFATTRGPSSHFAREAIRLHNLHITGACAEILYGGMQVHTPHYLLDKWANFSDVLSSCDMVTGRP